MTLWCHTPVDKCHQGNLEWSRKAGVSYVTIAVWVDPAIVTQFRQQFSHFGWRRLSALRTEPTWKCCAVDVIRFYLIQTEADGMLIFCDWCNVPSIRFMSLDRKVRVLHDSFKASERKFDGNRTFLFPNMTSFWHMPLADV